jgi:hypothetical protein
MRHLTAFFFTMAILAGLLSFGQTSSAQTPLSQYQSPAATQLQPPANAENPVQQPNSSAIMQAPPAPTLSRPWPRIKVHVDQRRQLRHMPDTPLDPQIDQGIFVKAAGPGSGCGSIVSYNFSTGENPQLQSVTTCTPSDAVTTQRTRSQDQNPKPQAPQLLKTDYSGKH